MTTGYPETVSFTSSVDLAFAPGFSRKPRSGREIRLVARFRDFLGEPTVDIGPASVTASKGTLLIPELHRSGNPVIIEEGAVGVSGEIAIMYCPESQFGKVEVQIACKLGESKLEFEIPRPTTHALTEVLESVIYAFFVAIIIRIFFFQTFWIPSGSMEPTLHEKDRIVANKLVYRLRTPERGEVVIFRVFQPGVRGGRGRLTFDEALEAVRETESIPMLAGKLTVGPVNEPGGVEVQDYIKRVIGLPGDVVEVRGGIIYVNGEPLHENFTTRPPNYMQYGPVTIPPGEVFVLGDNRSNSQDSHVIGPVPLENIEGRAELVFWPPARVGLIPQGK